MLEGFTPTLTTKDVYIKSTEGNYRSAAYQFLGYIPYACYLPCATNLFFYQSGGLQEYQKIITPPLTEEKKQTLSGDVKISGNSASGSSSSSSSGMPRRFCSSVTRSGRIKSYSAC